MRARAQVRVLPDGRRLHLQDGPIDIVLQAFGPEDQIRRAHRTAADVLSRCSTSLRRPPLPRTGAFGGTEPDGVAARRMFAAVVPRRQNFITPWLPWRRC